MIPKNLFFKRILLIILIGILSPIWSPLFIVKAQAQTFSDVTSKEWYFQAVENGVTKKYISAAQNYRPGDKMRRSETAKMLTIFGDFSMTSGATINFKDVPSTEWYAQYVKTLVANKVINGYLDKNGDPTGYFGPADFVTRNQTAALLNRILKLDYERPATSPFKDINEGHWAFKDVIALYQAGIIKGYDDKTYRGDNSITRAEMAKILDAAYAYLPEKSVEPNPPTPDPEKPNEPADSPALENEPISFSGPDGLNLTARIYKPEGNGPFPAVVFMHGCSGLLTGGSSTDYLASQYVWWGEEMTEEQNIVALFVDSFTPRNIQDGVCGDGGTTLNEATERPKDAYAGLAHLRELPYIMDNKIALMGWSNGGSAVLSAMAKNNNPVPLPSQGGFVTAIAEYPGCGLRGYYGTDYSTVSDSGTYLPYAPVTILAAAKDTTTPPEPKCTNLVNRAKELGAGEATNNSIMLNIYEGAGHSFDGAKADAPDADILARDVSRKVVINMLEMALK